MNIKCLALALLLCCSVLPGAADKMSLPDSLVSIDNIYVYSLTEPDKAQDILDRLRELNDDRLAFDYEMDWAQGDLYFNTGKYRLASYYFERVLTHEKIKTNRHFRMGLLSTMLECYRMNNNMEKTMETAIELLQITEEDGIREESGRAYQYMGEVFFGRKDSTQASHYFNKAEQELKAAAHIPYLYHFYIMYANLLAKENKNEQALILIRKAAEIVEQVAADPNMFPEGYEAFEISRFNAFAAEILARNGRYTEAETYYKAFMELHLDELSENKIAIVPYLLRSERYEEAIRFSLEREAYLRAHTDTIGDNMMAVKHFLATAYHQTGQNNKAIAYLEQALQLQEEINSRQLRSASEELVVIYETEKKDAALQKREAEARLHHSLLLGLSGITLLAVIILIITIRNYRNVKKNNRLMANRIKEIQRIREAQEKAAEEKNINKETQLFTRLEKLMHEDKLYRNPACNREMIMKRLGIDKHTLLETQRTNGIDSLTEYINSFRLQESIQLLETQPALSIEQIATQAGFGSARTLQRQFKDKYNMSPGAYRKYSSSTN